MTFGPGLKWDAPVNKMAEGTASYTDACMRGAEGLTEQVAQLTLMMQTMRTELLANMTQSHAAHAHAHSHKVPPPPLPAVAGAPAGATTLDCAYP